MSLIPLAIAFIMATVCAATLTPFVISWMWRWNIVDAPDGVRKLHGRTVPLAGGLAVLLAGMMSASMTLWTYPDYLFEHVRDFRLVMGLASACLWVSALGIVDDKGFLRGRQKFIGQVVAALILTFSGCVISRLEFMDIRLELGMFSVPFTIFWLVGAINAVNLIDGIDGLATSVGVILSGTFAVMALLTGHELEAILAVSLCGALLGFLPYNFPSARIFLGDTGSMLIGLMLGTLALRSSVKSQATLTLAAPLAVLSILIFDVGMAILRRKLTGRSLYSTDRGHLHHRLTQLGFPPVSVVLMVSLACLLCGCGAITSLVYRNEWIAISVASSVILSCMAAKIFGHNEFRLLYNRTKSFLRSLLRLSTPCGSKGMISAMQLQGRLNWTPIWNHLRQFAQGEDLVRIEFHISAPRAHEHYHAQWSRRTIELDRQWTTSIPLIHHGVIVGRITMSGELRVVSSEGNMSQIAHIVHGLKSTELMVEEVLSLAIPKPPAVHPVAAA